MSNLTDFLPGEMGKATQAQAEAGTADNVVMTPLTTAAAIGALSGHVVKEVITSSTVLFREDDDIAYFIEAIGAGEGGAWSASTSASAGANGGGYTSGFFSADEFGPSRTATIGAGGPGRTSDNRGGATPGGNTEVVGLLLAPGGGHPLAAANDGGVGGNSTGSVPGPSLRGGAGGAGSSSGISGGTSLFGGDGGSWGPYGDPNIGVNRHGKAPGGGGASTRNSMETPAGDGARGEIRVYRFKRVKQ